MKLRHLDLFSGIGGFSLGMEATGGFETVAFCEIEEYPRKVLQKHWPYVKQYKDIKELTYEKLKADGLVPIDIITGGYPCQPFSQAGKRAGEQDPRHLWPEMFRIIKELRPTWVVAENVSGHIKLGLEKPQGHLVLALVASARTTKEKESGLWLTPSATTISTRSKESMEKRKKYRESVGRTTVPPGNLAEQVQYGKPTTEMWPTPKTSDQYQAYMKKNEKGIPHDVAKGNLRGAVLWPTPQHSDHLANPSETLEAWEKRAKEKKKQGINLQFALRHAVQKNPGQMWPTPSKGMYKQDVNDDGRYARDIKKKGFQVMLPAAVKLYPTPRVLDTEGGVVKNVELIKGSFSRKNKKGVRWGVKLKDAVHHLEKPKTGGQLNPTWVEWIMGFPTGFTDLKR
jgi:hypothetical protein